MIVYYPNVIVALLLIHSHSTHQSTYNAAISSIEKEIRAEKDISQNTHVSLAQALAHELPFDIVCDHFDDNQKQSLCDEAMVHMINNRYGSGGGFFVTFLQEETDLQVPQLGKPRNKYACRGIRVEADGTDTMRDMYWCTARRFLKMNSDESDQWKGFFMSGSRQIVDKVYMFEPPQNESDHVRTVGKLESVELLATKARDLASLSARNAD